MGPLNSVNWLMIFYKCQSKRILMKKKGFSFDFCVVFVIVIIVVIVVTAAAV